MTPIRTLRDEPPLPNGAVLVRLIFDDNRHGRIFDRETLIADAARNFKLYGYYGLSLVGSSPAFPLDVVLAKRCRLSRDVALFTAADLLKAGLGIVPSGKAPHYDTSIGEVYGRSYGSVQVVAPSAEELVDRFRSATYTVMENDHYEPGLS